jgi:hypothetical protein
LLPPAVRGTGRPLTTDDRRGSTAAAAGFGTLALLGLGGMAKGVRPR